jgi:hypothetical protein
MSDYQRRQAEAFERIADLLETKLTADDLRRQWDEEEADRAADAGLALREERSRRLDDGWVPFGWHIVYPDVQLEFDGSDGTGLPVWERNREWITREASIESFAHAMAIRRRRMAQG